MYSPASSLCRTLNAISYPLHPQYNEEGEAKFVSTSLFSVAAAKATLVKQESDAEADTNKTLAEEGTSGEQVGRKMEESDHHL